MAVVEWRFHTPGFVDKELPASVHDAWHDWHVEKADNNLRQMLAQLGSDDPLDVAYVNPAKERLPDDRKVISVPWQGFPETVTTLFGTGDKALAKTDDRGCNDFGEPSSGRLLIVDDDGHEVPGDVRERQDEYLEWHAATRDGRLESVTFVAEAYDYWQFLFEHARDHVVERYQEWTHNPSLKPADLEAKTDLFLALSDGNGLVRRGREPIIA